MESDPQYENVNPGTVSVEGFGLECWDYEENFGKKREKTILVSSRDMPSILGRQLLRIIHELRRGSDKLGWNPEREKANLKEFCGITRQVQKYLFVADNNLTTHL